MGNPREGGTWHEGRKRNAKEERKEKMTHIGNVGNPWQFTMSHRVVHAGAPIPAGRQSEDRSGPTTTVSTSWRLLLLKCCVCRLAAFWLAVSVGVGFPPGAAAGPALAIRPLPDGSDTGAGRLAVAGTGVGRGSPLTSGKSGDFCGRWLSEDRRNHPSPAGRSIPPSSTRRRQNRTR